MRIGDLSLSECLFFLGHDPFSGKAKLRSPVLTAGLAGAALGDLLLDERITLDHGIVVLAGRTPTGEPIADRVLSQIIAEKSQLDVRDWLEHLRPGIFDTVVETLTVRQMVVPNERRGMFRLSLHYEPADLRIASTPRAALRTAILLRKELDLPTATLALLAWAVGLTDVCEPELTRRELSEWGNDISGSIGEPVTGLVAAVRQVAEAHGRR